MADELYRTVFDKAQDAMLVADDEARYVAANPAATTLTGFAHDELLKMTVMDLTPADSRAAGLEMWRAFLARGELGGEYRLRRKDGSFVDVEFRAVAHAASGRHLSILRDVTERKELEARQERILAIVSHDLRTPLSAIELSAGMLQRKLADRPEARTVERILASSRRMTEILTDLLDYARSGARIGFALSRVAVDAHALCEAVADEVRTANPQSQIALHLDGEATGEWDRGRLQQLVTNLIVNAVKHGDGTVDVRSRGDEEEWTLTVHNCGTPIDRDLLPRIFDPFRSGRGGTGLGLYIARAIAHAHGGSIDVASDERSGTTFTVRMPRALARQSAHV